MWKGLCALLANESEPCLLMGCCTRPKLLALQAATSKAHNTAVADFE